jgi:hypothetical protein
MKVRKIFEFTGKKLFLCDMRPGFSEDGVECILPNGNYELSIEPSQSGSLRKFSLVLAGETPDGHIDKGDFSIDMARVGILNREAFLEFFDGNWEALFDWSDGASDGKKSDWGAFLYHKEAGLEALYVDIGSDCECAVQSLRSGDKTVGVRVIPQPPTKRPTKKSESRQWTQLEVKCSGIAEPWNFCDDWDYKPEIESILEDVVSEVSSVDEGESLTFLDTESIDPDAAISTYQRRFKGVTHISVFLEHSEEEDWKRLSIPKSYSFPKLGAQTTSRELAKAIFDIFKNARRWD